MQQNFPAVPTTPAASLVTLTDGEPRTTTLMISEGTENDHASVIKLVRTYLNDLEEFGLVRFEIRPRLKGQHGGADVEYATLNEGQATLLLTYMRNSDIVREFKKRLVRDFLSYKQQASHNPASMSPQLQLANAMLIAGRMIEEQKSKIEQRDKLISHLSPKAQITDRLNGAEGNLTIRNAAKALKMKEHKFTDWLQIKKYAFRNKKGRLEGYSDYVPRYLDHKVHPIPTDGEPDRVSFQMMITPEGLVRFAKLLNVDMNEQENFFQEAA